jgi:hypothetical protein
MRFAALPLTLLTATSVLNLIFSAMLATLHVCAYQRPTLTLRSTHRSVAEKRKQNKEKFKVRYDLMHSTLDVHSLTDSHVLRIRDFKNEISELSMNRLLL